MQDNGLISIIQPRIWSYKNIYKTISPFSKVAILLVAAAVLGGSYFGAHRVLERINGLYLVAVPLKAYLLKMACFSFFCMLAMSAMISFMSTMFTAKDLPVLFSMPIPYRRVFAAKFIETSFFSVSSAYVIFVVLILAISNSYSSPAWHFILALAIATPFFYIFPVALGCIAALLVARYFPVNHARKVMYYLLIVVIAFLVVLFRALEPERLVSVEKFEAFANYLMNLDSQGFTLDRLPTSWISSAMSAIFAGDFGPNFQYNLALAYIVTALSVAACGAMGAAMYRDCYLKYQEEQDASGAEGGGLAGAAAAPFIKISVSVYSALLSLLPPDLATVLDKDVKTFARTQTLVVQSLMMIVVTIFYLYNVTLMPVATKALPPDIVDMFGFMNIGMIALIVASYAIRFVFPVFSMEGRAFYIVKTSSIDMRNYLRLKFYSNFIPMFLFSMALCAISCSFMPLRKTIVVVSFIDTAVLTFFICHLNLYLGIIFPVLDASVSEIPASFGGMVTMVLCAAYTALFLIFEAAVMYFEFFSRFNVTFSWLEYGVFAILAAAFAAFTVAGFLVPRRLATAKMINFYEEVRV